LIEQDDLVVCNRHVGQRAAVRSRQKQAVVVHGKVEVSNRDVHAVYERQAARVWNVRWVNFCVAQVSQVIDLLIIGEVGTVDVLHERSQVPTPNRQVPAVNVRQIVVSKNIRA
jgi:hypothetical protein